VDRFQQAQNVVNYKQVFESSKYGKEVLAELASFAMMDVGTFNPDPQISAFNQGKYAVVLHIMQQLNIDVREYLTSNVTLEDYNYG